MKVLPQAMATADIHIGTMAGKLNGVMPATTPRGWRRECMSTPVDTPEENSPLSRCGMPQANSTTSAPRMREPLASARTLPCSEEISAASSSACFSSRVLNLNITRARAMGEAAAQAGKAAAASAMAASISALEAKGACEATRPVEGSKTSPKRPLFPEIFLPPMRCWSSLAMGPPLDITKCYNYH